MIRLWLICVVLFFGLAQFYHWLLHLPWFHTLGAEHFSLPFPILIMAGAVLAIASNYTKRAGLLFGSSQPSSVSSVSEPESSQPTTPNFPAAVPPASAQPQPSPPLQPGISFTIDKVNHRSERRPS